MTKLSSRRTRSLAVNALARVEGEGGMVVHIEDGKVTDVRLDIYEPPRFFEAFLRGRTYTEPPDLTARICGICPVAYQMSACQAIEDACGVEVPEQIRVLRRLLYCGEWIESHALHIYLLHAPDFLGYDGMLDMARDHATEVERGLQLKKVGNDLIELVGGRAIHPINVKVGGFFAVPTPAKLAGLAASLEWAREAALETVRWVAGFDFPDFEPDYEFVALQHADEYPILSGRVVSSGGLDVDVSAFEQHVVEHQVEHSNALHARLDGRTYLAGPLARFALNADRLSPSARAAATDAGLSESCRNPFRSIIVRAVEVLHAVDEALRIIADYEQPAEPSIRVEPRPGTGYGVTEAPRGLLYHRYELSADGLINRAQIIPPTSQNQGQIEADLRAFVESHLDLELAELTHACEQVIRSYDPCISCATHFLTLRVERS
ncbi:MAG: Ni/Fe hydrogenase subunit alpha [Nocardioidaceae bacterium]